MYEKNAKVTNYGLMFLLKNYQETKDMKYRFYLKKQIELEKEHIEKYKQSKLKDKILTSTQILKSKNRIKLIDNALLEKRKNNVKKCNFALFYLLF